MALSFSITFQYGDRLECHPGHRFFSDYLCRNEPITARQRRANGVWSRLVINNFLKGLCDRTCKPLKSQRDMSNQCMIDAFGLQVSQRYTPQEEYTIHTRIDLKKNPVLHNKSQFSLVLRFTSVSVFLPDRAGFSLCTCRTVEKKEVFSMIIGNEKLMHECFPKHLRMGTARMK